MWDELGFTDHFAKDKIQFFSCGCAFQHFQVLLPDLIPIHPVHIWVIEIVAFEAPGIYQYLAPLFARLYPHLHFRGAELLVQLLSFVGGDNVPGSAFSCQQVFTVGRELVAVYVFEYRLGFTFVEIEELKRLCLISGAGVWLLQIEELAVGGREVAVVT